MKPDKLLRDVINAEAASSFENEGFWTLGDIAHMGEDQVFRCVGVGRKTLKLLRKEGLPLRSRPAKEILNEGKAISSKQVAHNRLMDEVQKLNELHIEGSEDIASAENKEERDIVRSIYRNKITCQEARVVSAARTWEHKQ